MTTMARESRKWNLSIGLYTQSIDDIPSIIIELSTMIVILGAGTDRSIDDMAARFGLNGACKYALGHLGKPGPAGSNLVSLSYNALATGSGLFYIDPKASPKLAVQIWQMARYLGRDDDFRVLNYGTSIQAVLATSGWIAGQH